MTTLSKWIVTMQGDVYPARTSVEVGAASAFSARDIAQAMYPLARVVHVAPATEGEAA